MWLNTSPLNVHLAPGYATEDFMLAWTEFVADCGVPRRVHSDRGTQLISAADEVEGPAYDWDKISEQDSRTAWNFCPSGSQWRNGAIESFVKRFKWSLSLYQQSGMNYAELQSAFKRIASVLNSRPISARFGPRHSESDPDYLEMITPNMLLTARTGVDLPVREYADEESPSRRLAYKQKLESDWWQQWKVQCFDSLIPTKTWTVEKRGVKVGDVVLISYKDLSKTGTYKLGRVNSVEVDEDGLVRTCTVDYRLVRSDLPVEELRLYFKGLKCKELRVPVQRLCIILPVEEQGESGYLGKKAIVKQVDDVTEEVMCVAEVTSVENSKVTEGDFKHEECTEDYDDVQLNDERQISARSFLVKNYKCAKMKKMRTQETSRSVKFLHMMFSEFMKNSERCESEDVEE